MMIKMQEYHTKVKIKRGKICLKVLALVEFGNLL